MNVALLTSQGGVLEEVSITTAMILKEIPGIRLSVQTVKGTDIQETQKGKFCQCS